MRACLCALVLLCGIFILKGVFSRDYDHDHIFLAASISSPEDGFAALYYDTGKGFDDNHVVFVPIKGSGRVYDYLFKMPNRTIYQLRWNLLFETQGPISFYKIGILDGFRGPAVKLNLKQLEPLSQIGKFELSSEKADLQIQERANDPQIRIRLGSSLSVKKRSALSRFVSGLFLEFLGFSLIACLLIFIWFCQKDKVLAVLVMIAVVFFVSRCWVLYDDAKSLFLEVAMSSSVSSMAQVFYDVGQGMHEDQSKLLHTTRGKELRKYRFKLPNTKIYHLRYDPMLTGGEARIGNIKVTDAYWNLLREIPLRQLRLIDPYRVVYYEDDGLEIVFPNENKDPKIAIPLNEDLNFTDKLPFPIVRWCVSVVTETAFIVLVAFVFIWAWKRRRNFF